MAYGNYFFRNWWKMAERMSSRDKETLKAMYGAFQVLEKDELQLLMDKYYKQGKPFTDKEMAEKYGISVGQFRGRRGSIEARVLVILHEFTKERSRIALEKIKRQARKGIYQ